MHVLGSGPTLLLGAQTQGDASGEGSETSMRKVQLIISCLEVLVPVECAEPGKTDTQSKARGTGMTGLNSGILVTSSRCVGSGSPTEDQGAPKRPRWGFHDKLLGVEAGLYPVQLRRALSSGESPACS